MWSDRAVDSEVSHVRDPGDTWVSEVIRGLGTWGQRQESSVWAEGMDPGLATAQVWVIRNPLCWGPRAESVPVGAGRRRQFFSQSINQPTHPPTHPPPKAGTRCAGE